MPRAGSWPVPSRASMASKSAIPSGLVKSLYWRRGSCQWISAGSPPSSSSTGMIQARPLVFSRLKAKCTSSLTGEDCSACHTTNYVVGGFGPMNMTQATHAGVGTTCNACHEAGLSFYMGAASPGLQGRPTDHTGALAIFKLMPPPSHSMRGRLKGQANLALAFGLIRCE